MNVRAQQKSLSQAESLELQNRTEITMTIEQLEERVATLERELAEVKQLLASSTLLPASSPLPPVKPNWIEAITGSMADFPEFAEVVRLGREWRESQRPAEDEEL